MAETRQHSGPTGTTTQQLTTEKQQQESLKLTKKKAKKALSRQVSWIAGTVDNESLNKKKSKCCCIYVKPSKFGESEEEDDDECENCRGHGSSLRRDGSLRSPPPEPEEDPSQPGTSGRKPTLMPCIKKVLSGASIENAANKKERK